MFFYSPETRWRSTPWASFDVIVQEVIAHRRGNPWLMQKFGKSIDQREVENEVDAFIAEVCARMNWTQFIVGTEGTAPPPKQSPPSQTAVKQLAAAGAKVRLIWAGIRTLGEWLDSGGEPVAQPLAESRAATCAACPLNGDGDFSKWFVAPAAAAIKKMVEKAQARKLTTASDAKLGICQGCLCPMKLKVHAPIEFIKGHTSDSTMDALRQGKDCWVIAELAKA